MHSACHESDQYNANIILSIVSAQEWFQLCIAAKVVVREMTLLPKQHNASANYSGVGLNEIR